MSGTTEMERAPHTEDPARRPINHEARGTSWGLVVAGGLGGLAVVGGLLLGFWRDHTRLAQQLSQSEIMLRTLRTERQQATSEKTSIAQELKTLQANVESYVALNTKLHTETGHLQQRLDEATQALTHTEEKATRLQQEMTRQQDQAREATGRELAAVKQEAETLSARLQRERAIFQYNLGVVYAQTGRYDEAIEAYDHALGLDPHNAEAHYNLGLLWDHVKHDPSQAAEHYRRYLVEKPDAEDREEISRLIASLTAPAGP